MQLEQLAHFLADIDHGSISGAAESQHVMQPALTRSIRRLEETVGAQLLERVRPDVVATTYGRAHGRLGRAEAAHPRDESGEALQPRVTPASAGSGSKSM